MSSCIILQHKRDKEDLNEIPETYEELKIFAIEHFQFSPEQNLSFKYFDANGDINMITESNYSQRKLQEILDTKDPKIIIEKDDDEDEEEEEDDDDDNKKNNKKKENKNQLDNLSYTNSSITINTQSNISENKPSEIKQIIDLNNIKETETILAKIKNDNKEDKKDDKDGGEDDDDDELDLNNIEESKTEENTKILTNIEKKDESKNEEKDKIIEDLKKQLKEKNEELKKKVKEYEETILKKDMKIKIYENKAKRMEKIFEDILLSMNEKLNDEMDKKLENKINKINQYYEEKLKEKKGN